VSQFPDGETRIALEESVRGADCFVIQSTCAPVNHNLMELLVLVDALRRASAWRVNAVIPYFGYARQDKKVQAREPITAKLVANLLETAGVDRVITIDLHAGQIQGFFDVPVDHLTALDILGNHLRATDLDGLGRRLARRRSRHRGAPPGELPRAAAGDALQAPHQPDRDRGHPRDRRREGLRPDHDRRHDLDRRHHAPGHRRAVAPRRRPDVRVAATHAVFTPPALERLTHEAITHVYVTDTIPFAGGHDASRCCRSPLLAKAISTSTTTTP
jgi:ribose-phosphate pyrophosphokinase